MSQTLFDAAKYIIDKYNTMTTMKLHTLLYCCQAKYLATHNTVLFDDDFHAWRHTPVNIDLFRTYQGGPMLIHFNDDRVFDWHADPTQLSDAQCNIIDTVCDALIPYSRVQLCSQIMVQPPFIDALARTASSNYRDGAIIDTDLMRIYYNDHPIINLPKLTDWSDTNTPL